MRDPVNQFIKALYIEVAKKYADNKLEESRFKFKLDALVDRALVQLISDLRKEKE